jgi:hypothetical protein
MSARSSSCERPPSTRTSCHAALVRSSRSRRSSLARASRSRPVCAPRHVARLQPHRLRDLLTRHWALGVAWALTRDGLHAVVGSATPKTCFRACLVRTHSSSLPPSHGNPSGRPIRFAEGGPGRARHRPTRDRVSSIALDPGRVALVVDGAGRSVGRERSDGAIPVEWRRP